MANFFRWIPHTLLLFTGLLFVVSANRGLDLSDESYYLLNYLNWRELSATSTFFGAYIELPFRMLGRNLAAIRIFGLAVLCACTAIFFHGLVKLSQQITGDIVKDYSANLIAVISACFLYYSFYFTLRAPSYNLISLSCILSATGILFHILSSGSSSIRKTLATILYGLVISILVFTKATTGAALILLHFVFLLIYGNRGFLYLVKDFLPMAVLGAAINIALLSVVAPHWFDMMINGVSLGNTLDQRNQLVPASLFVLGQDLLKDFLNNWFYYFGFLIINGIVFASPFSKHKYFGGWWLLIAIAAAVLMFVTQRPVATWVSVLSILYFGMWCADCLSRDSYSITRNDYFILSLWVFLILMTLAFSIGTNLPLIRHSVMSVVLPLAGMLLMLNRLRIGEIMSEFQHRLALVSICLLALAFQVMPWVDKKYTYRLRAPLYSQKEPIDIPGAVGAVLIDKQTATQLKVFVDMLKSAGFRRGMQIMDLTGDNPGLVYLAGGKPLGVAWILGGYKGSDIVFSRITQLVGSERVKCSWLLTSDDSHRRIAKWQETIKAEVGVFDHQPMGGFAYLPGYGWKNANPVPSKIVLWRPRSLSCNA